MSPELVQFIVNLAGLTIASYMDVKSREIEDYVWYLMLIASIPLLIFRFNTLIGNAPLLLLYLISLVTGISVALILYKFTLMGGADAKALIVLSINEIPLLHKDPLSLLPPLSIFVNSTLFSLSVIPFILARNTLYLLTRGSLFKGFEKEDIKKKVLCFLTAYKVPFDTYLKNKYMYSLAESRENGEKRLKIGVRLEEEEGELNVIDLKEEVWVSPLLPLIVFIEIGYIVYFFWGNIVGLILTLI